MIAIAALLLTSCASVESTSHNDVLCIDPPYQTAGNNMTTEQLASALRVNIFIDTICGRKPKWQKQ